MENLLMCRICLAEDVPMYIVVNRSLHELYEKLTDIPFVTEDGRPILACSFCCTKLKQCCRLMRKCLEAEELFAQMMNEDYEPNPSINPDRLEFYGGLVKTEIHTISIVDVDQTESVVVKEELPAVCERLDDIIVIKEDFQNHDNIKQENLDSGDLDREEEVLFPPLFFEEEDDVPSLEVEIEVEKVEEFSKQKLQNGETYRPTVAKKPKLATRGTKIEDVKAVKKNKNVLALSNMIQKTEIHTFQEPFNEPKPSIDIFNNNNFVKDTNSRKRKNRGDWTCERRKKENSHKCDICQRCFNHKGHLTRHMLQHTGEKPYKCEECHRRFSQLSGLKRHVLTHYGEKPYKCDSCQCSYIDKRDLTKHILLHSGEKPFKCEICRFSCNDKRDLTKHIRKHKGQRAVCEICEQSFSFASDLKKHVRIHTGEKPYICDICHRGFNVKSNLTKHILAHRGSHFV